MLKKFVSYLIIFSLFYTDVANAMQSEGPFYHDDMNLKVRPPLPRTQPLRRIKSSENFSTSQGSFQKGSSSQDLPLPIESPPSFQKGSSSQDLPLPIGSNHSNESLLKGSPLSSSTDSERKSDDEGTSTHATISIENSNSSQNSPSKSSNESLSKGNSPTGSLQDEALDQFASKKSSQSSLQDEVGFSLEERGEQKPVVSHIIMVSNASLPVKHPEFDQEDKNRVNPLGSIQDFDDTSPDSFTSPQGKGSVLDLFVSSSGDNKKVAPTERSPLLRQSSSRSSIQELRLTSDERRDSRELLVVRKANGTSSHPQEIDDILPLLANHLEDLEEGQSSKFQHFLNRVKQLKPDEDDTDRRTMAFLTHAKQHIVDGKFTWKQILLAGILGTLIGGGYGNGMIPVLNGGLRGIGPVFYQDIVNNNTGATIFIVHTGITRGIDSMSRNIKIIGNLAGPSTEKFSVAHKKYKIWKIEIDPRNVMVVAVCLGSAASSLLAFWYIWDAEEWNIKNGSGSLRAGSIGFVAGFGPCLFADALLLHVRSVIPWVDEIFNQRAIRSAFRNPTSPESVVRQQELKRLKDLERFFKFVPDEDIHGLYEDVLVNGFKITKNGPHIPEVIKGADFLRVLKVLRKTHEGYHIPEAVKETWKKFISKTASWVIPTLATVGRSFVFYFIMDSLFESIGMPSGFARGAMSWILGGGLASLFLGKVEKDAVEDGVYDLLHGQEREGDASHSCVRGGFRKFGKFYDYLQGAEDTLPYLFTGTLATQGWSPALQITVLIFFGIADLFNNTMGYHESYGDVFYTGESLVSKISAPVSYKRRKLLGLVRDLRQRVETLRPDVLMKVNEMISDEEIVNFGSEID